MSDYRLTNPETIKNFLYGGRAIFSLRSQTSGEHWTFRVTRKDTKSPYFVSLLVDGQNYMYLGYIRDNQYGTSTKSCRKRGHHSHKAFIFLLNNLAAGRLHSKLEFWHEGQCARCGKPLTDPASIERGFGPTCFSKI